MNASLANTKEVLEVVNRPGHETCHEGWVKWIDGAVQLMRPYGERICLGGDTDFSLTENFDRWDAQGTGFIFGMDGHGQEVAADDLLSNGAAYRGMTARAWNLKA